MAKKGQTFVSYSLDTKIKAVEMRLQGLTKKQVAEELNIHDIGRLKVWMRKYRESGVAGLIDHRKREQPPESTTTNQE